MKTLKRNIFIKSLLLIMVVAFLGSCKKSGGDDGDGNNLSAGKGTFALKGSTYSGLCTSVTATSGVSGNIDVLITTTNGSSFIIYNMPTGNSGSNNVFDFDTDNAAFTGKLYAISLLNSSSSFYSVSGNVTKTGSKSFNFSITMMDQTTNQTTSATGSGSY